MATVSFRINGLKGLQDNIKKLARQFPNEFKKQVKTSTINIDRNAKRFAPVDTGRLRSSIRFEIVDGSLTGEVTANTDYADKVELGTSRQSAQPYLGPAWRLEVARFEGKLIKRINDTARGV